MKRLLLIGIGPGDPDYVTVQAIKAMNRVDVFFVLEKEGQGKDELTRIRRDILDRYVTEKRYRIVTAQSPERRDDQASYRDGVAAWYGRKAEVFADLIANQMDEDECGGLLIWGDPALYDGTLRVLEQVRAAGLTAFDYELIPGISSIQALMEKHRILLNRVGEPITVTTARRLARCSPEEVDNAVVMLDSNAGFRHLADSDLWIYWGAYLGTDDEMLVAGPLKDVAAELEERIARVKAEKGWLMDIYLLRRPDSEDGGAEAR